VCGHRADLGYVAAPCASDLTSEDFMANGGSSLTAAIVLGVAFLAGAFVVKSGLDEQATQLSEVVASLGKVEEAVRAGGLGRPMPPRAEGPSGPDPGKKYEVDLANAPVRGDADAAVTIVAFSDFQCPFCNRVNPTLAKLLETYPGKVNVAFKHMPLRIHPDAPAAHAAAVAAGNQGKFWEMHDKIFANQRDLKPETFQRYATELGLDRTKFDKDVADPATKERVDADMKEAEKLGVGGTPAFFINGKFLSGAQPFESFDAIVKEQLGNS
jgi:protein-disulfide isomerase